MTDYLVRVLELSNLLAAVEVFVRLLASWYVLRAAGWFFWHVLALDSWKSPLPYRTKLPVVHTPTLKQTHTGD